MSNKPFATSVAVLLIIALVAPATFFIAPQRASAQSGAIGCIGAGIGALFGLTGSAAVGVSGIGGVPVVSMSGNTLAGIGNSIGGQTAGATTGECIYQLIIVPLARSMMRNILQSITSSIISWITGANGTGQPSFVQNLSRHLQAVGDAVALPFINQVRMVLSPQFGAAIASSLLANYARGTSVGGFLAANQSTLGRYSPNPSAFLAGNFSQGGIPAWFALTTQNENNPYLAKIAANDQLGSLVAQAQANRRQDLVQSKGFLSWCGATNSSMGPSGINPGVVCRNSDGTESPVKTPGTVIQGYAQQALGSGIAQLINPQDIDSALAAILSAAVNQVIQGVFGAGGGLFGASQPSSIRPQAITDALQNTAASNSSAMTSANAVADAALTRATNYSSAWNTIGTAASSAAASVAPLKNIETCASQSSVADSDINSTLAQMQQASSDVSTTQALANRVKQEAASGASAALTTDTQVLGTMIPDASVTSARADAVPLGGATANPTGSLSVSGGTLVDRMNLISQNAQNLNATSCVAPTP
ncbi:hypothetical protein A2118_01360 [Candidatus Kaiserbacteria bacterium GWA2_50_9]|uniref:Uncharacterized protein n=1 Tax=Candidatus Kaiserbacteria bacterium GWA2_50_9 TaxID=1798474 RepID=A0A1F6BTT5_9BACT|nr:MAG: hypothetical protein A2118_01360 [Candidatus Kaiserbacteria bacterium GWA2_50_9]